MQDLYFIAVCGWLKGNTMWLVTSFFVFLNTVTVQTILGFVCSFCVLLVSACVSSWSVSSHSREKSIWGYMACRYECEYAWLFNSICQLCDELSTCLCLMLLELALWESDPCVDLHNVGFCLLSLSQERSPSATDEESWTELLCERERTREEEVELVINSKLG